MNDARRQILHEIFKLIDLGIMVMAFFLAAWIASEHKGMPIGALMRDALPVNEAGSEEKTAEVATPTAARPLGTAPAGAAAVTGAAGAAHAGQPAADSGGADSQGDSETRPPAASAADRAASPAPPSADSPSADSPSVDSHTALRTSHPVIDVHRPLEDGDEDLGLLGWLAPMERFLERTARLLRIKLIAYIMFMALAWYAFFASRGLYNSRRLESRLSESLDVLRASFLGSLVVSALATLVFQETYNISPYWARMIEGVDQRPLFFPVVFFLLASGSTIVARLLIRNILERARLRGRNLRAVLIVGTNHRALRFANSIQSKPEMGYYVSGFVDEEWDGIAGFKKGGHELVASLKGLGQYLADNVVDEVVVALPVSSAYIYSSRIVSLCQEQGITVRFISQIFDSRLAKGRLEVFESEPMLSLEGSPDEGFGKLVKKIFDTVVAALLLVVLAPLFGIVALAIKVIDPGPVFFVQTRVGHNKRRFKLYKFRTMVVDAEKRLEELEHLNQVPGPVFKIEKDPRVTSLGEFLRKTSIDELPQLWNVLKGDMSMVGPRPLPERDYRGFDTDAHRRRLSVRPGLTCTWQVSGRNSIPFERWMEMDLEYIDSWSLWLDFMLLLRTIPVVLGPLLFFRRGEFVKGQTQPQAEPLPSKSGGSR